GSRSPIGAICGAPTACRPKGSPGCRATSSSRTTKWSGWWGSRGSGPGGGRGEIWRETVAMRPRPRLSVTTNGIGLERLAGALREAGLDRVNVSLDTLDPVRFEALTRRNRHEEGLPGLARAPRAGLTPVKINSVLMRGVNDDEAPALLRFALDHGYELRFIEQMPLDAQHGWDRRATGRAAGVP